MIMADIYEKVDTSYLQTEIKTAASKMENDIMLLHPNLAVPTP